MNFTVLVRMTTIAYNKYSLPMACLKNDKLIQ